MNMSGCRAKISSVAAVYDRRINWAGAQRARLQFPWRLIKSSAMAHFSRPKFSRRGGRAVDRAGLENRKAERPREFESHPLRVFAIALPCELC